MHYSSHVRKIRDALRTCLSEPKVKMLGELRNCVLAAKSLLKSSEFDYYIRQFELLELEEFATTRYAKTLVNQILGQSSIATENTRQKLAFEVSLTCENILAYTIDDFCFMQSEFHWYFCLDEGFAYKESEMGVIEAPLGNKVEGASRVAKISELPEELRKNLI